MQVFFLFLLLFVSDGFILSDGPEFQNGTLIGTVQDQRKKKLDGCGASRRHLGILYAENGNHHYGSIIYAIDTSNAQVVGSITLQGVQIINEWSDMAVGPCPDLVGSCIYVGDIGSDKGHAPANKMYYIREPDSINGDQTLAPDGQLTFSYSGSGSKALMVDNSGELYIISLAHAGEHALFFWIPKHAWGSNIVTSASVGTFIGVTSQQKDPVGGDISPNGKEILAKMQEKIYLWKVPENMSGTYSDVFLNKPTAVPYIYVWQDEAVCWAHDGSGYYTLPEGENPPLHFYARNTH